MILIVRCTICLWYWWFVILIVGGTGCLWFWLFVTSHYNGCEAWSLTETLERSLDGSYTRMLRKALNVHWSSHTRNEDLYEDLPRLSNTIAGRRLQLAGHCFRHPELSAQPLVLWQPNHGHRGRGRPKATYVDTLKRDTGTSDSGELAALMRDRIVWREHIGRQLATEWVSDCLWHWLFVVLIVRHTDFCDDECVLMIVCDTECLCLHSPCFAGQQCARSLLRPAIRWTAVCVMCVLVLCGTKSKSYATGNLTNCIKLYSMTPVVCNGSPARCYALYNSTAEVANAVHVAMWTIRQTL